MRYIVKPNGRLVILADNQDRANLKYAYECGGYPAAESAVTEMLHERLTFIPPENIGALTDAPILTDDADWPDEARPVAGGGESHGPFPYDATSKVWYFKRDQIRDPWEELKNVGRVELDSAD